GRAARRCVADAWPERRDPQGVAPAAIAGSSRCSTGKRAWRRASRCQSVMTPLLQTYSLHQERMMDNDNKQIAVVLDEPMLAVDTDSRSPFKWGLLILLIGFGGFVYWSAFAPLDAGVPADATVHVAGNRKTIQHLEGG